MHSNQFAHEAAIQGTQQASACVTAALRWDHKARYCFRVFPAQKVKDAVNCWQLVQRSGENGENEPALDGPRFDNNGNVSYRRPWITLTDPKAVADPL